MSYSVSTLLAAASCEFAAVRAYEIQQGWRTPPCGAASRALCEDAQCIAHGTDEMMERLARLGDAHEQSLLAAFLDEHGVWIPGNSGGVFRAELEDPSTRSEMTALAFSQRAAVLFQVEIMDGNLVGRADFVVLQDNGEYAVYDTKLARSARSSAVLQITAYSEALRKTGVPMSRYGYLALGSGEITRHSVADAAPVSRRLRAGYERLIGARTPTQLAQWNGADGLGSSLSTCGRCDECECHLVSERDVLLVMGCTTAHRVKLNAAGIRTVEQLAAIAPSVLEKGEHETSVPETSVPEASPHEKSVPENSPHKNSVHKNSVLELDRSLPAALGIDINAGTLAKLVAQAHLFLEGEHSEQPLFHVIDAKPFGLLKPESPGDIFFDFEGDPLYAEPGSHEWGLEYLFGWCTRDSAQSPDRKDFFALWAHNRIEEKRAFEQFVDYLVQRLAEFPDMHVYHYAPYETTALKKLALRHGTREEELDALLRHGLFIDLYAVVRGAIRTSGRSLSIKKLEPFYLDELGVARAGVTNAADSITEYASAMELRAQGDALAFEQKIALIEDYNRYDCESTFHLLNWIGSIAEDNGVQWREASGMEQLVAPEDIVEPEISERVIVADALREHLDRLTESWLHQIAEAEAHNKPVPAEPDARKITRMAWAAIDYYQRENKQYWWAHFARLSDPVDEWTGSDIFRPTRAEVQEDWHVPARARTQKRLVRLYGELEQGSKLHAGSDVFVIYDDPVPFGMATSSNGIRGFGNGKVEDVEEIASQPGYAVITVLESTAKGNDTWAELPMGLGPGRPINTASIDNQLLEFGREVLEALNAQPDDPDFGNSARIQLLRRVGTAVHLEVDEAGKAPENIDNILASLRSVENGVVAVQGPPGAGKTFVASRVITTLARAGWNIGVVAQSHAVVENVLNAVLKNGLPKDQVAKKPAAGNKDPEYPFTYIDGKTAQEFFRTALTGTVTGGTAWSYSTEDFNPEEGYDLIVIDEAGQYSMANSLAVTHKAQRILLLGDPQQLPQVSQGSHPEPVNESALAWLVGEDPTITADRGFFLDKTWRMHPELTRAVSELSYEGKLSSVPVTAERYVEDLAPGLHTLLVEHCGNTVSSTEEAEAIIKTIQGLIGKEWQATHEEAVRVLEASDFIVVAPYNAQVQLLRELLDNAGLEETSVGTVDKFQGQEAPIALVSLAVSDAEGSPRGLEFVRNRNRLNVSISRGKHSAFLVHSEALLDAVDMSVRGIEEHGAFIRLSESGLH